MDVNINGASFSASDVTIGLFGRVDLRISKISYEDSQEVKGVKVLGNRKDVAVLRGGYSASGSITILEEDIASLEKQKGSIYNFAPQTITVVKFNGTQIIKEEVRNVVFTKNPREASAGGSDALMRQLDFYAGDIVTVK